MGPTPLIWAYKLICTRRIGFRHHIYGPDTIYMGLSSKLIPASFRHWLYGPVTTFMGLGPRNQCRAHETCVGPTKPVSGPRKQCRAHEICVGPTKSVSGPRKQCRAHEIGVGPTKMWRKNTLKSIFEHVIDGISEKEKRHVVRTH